MRRERGDQGEENERSDSDKKSVGMRVRKEGEEDKKERKIVKVRRRERGRVGGERN